MAEDWGLESKLHDWNWGHVQGTGLPQLLEGTKILWPRKEYLFNKVSHTVRETQNLPGDCPVHPSLWSIFTSKILFKTHTTPGGHQFLCPLPILPGLSEWLSVHSKQNWDGKRASFRADLSVLPLGYMQAERGPSQRLQPYSACRLGCTQPLWALSALHFKELPAGWGPEDPIKEYETYASRLLCCC